MDVSIIIVIDRIAVLRFVSITSAVEVEMLLNPKGLRMVSPPGFQIYLWPRVTLIFDGPTPKVDQFHTVAP